MNSGMYIEYHAEIRIRFIECIEKTLVKDKTGTYASSACYILSVIFTDADTAHVVKIS